MKEVTNKILSSSLLIAFHFTEIGFILVELFIQKENDQLLDVHLVRSTVYTRL